MKILIKYATRGRPEWFKRTIQNITSTISPDADYLILVTADEDDVTMNNTLMKVFMRGHENVICCFGNSSNKVDAINRDMNLIGNWDLLINMSDDMQWIMKNWDTHIISAVSNRWPEGDFFAHFNDGYTRDLLPTMSIMDRKYYDRDGYIYHPSYRSFSCDAEAMYVAQMRGRYHYFPEVLFLHQHPTNRPSPADATYKRNSLHTDHDTKNYFERLNRYFDIPEHERVGGVPFLEHIGRTK